MSTEQVEKFQDEVVIPEGVTITQKKHMLEFVGPLGKTYKSFRTIPVKIGIVEGKVIIKTIGFRKNLLPFKLHYYNESLMYLLSINLVLCAC